MVWASTPKHHQRTYSQLASLKSSQYFFASLEVRSPVREREARGSEELHVLVPSSIVTGLIQFHFLARLAASPESWDNRRSLQCRETLLLEFCRIRNSLGRSWKQSRQLSTGNMEWRVANIEWRVACRRACRLPEVLPSHGFGTWRNLNK